MSRACTLPYTEENRERHYHFQEKMGLLPKADEAYIKANCTRLGLDHQQEGEARVSDIGEQIGYFGVYSDFGFFHDFTSNHSQSRTTLECARRQRWLDQSTRAVTLAFIVHNKWNDNYYRFTYIFENAGVGVYKSTI